MPSVTALVIFPRQRMIGTTDLAISYGVLQFVDE